MELDRNRIDTDILHPLHKKAQPYEWLGFVFMFTHDTIHTTRVVYC